MRSPSRVTAGSSGSAGVAARQARARAARCASGRGASCGSGPRRRRPRRGTGTRAGSCPCRCCSSAVGGESSSMPVGDLDDALLALALLVAGGRHAHAEPLGVVEQRRARRGRRSTCPLMVSVGIGHAAPIDALTSRRCASSSARTASATSCGRAVALLFVAPVPLGQVVVGCRRARARAASVVDALRESVAASAASTSSVVVLGLDLRRDFLPVEDSCRWPSAFTGLSLAPAAGTGRRRAEAFWPVAVGADFVGEHLADRRAADRHLDVAAGRPPRSRRSRLHVGHRRREQRAHADDRRVGTCRRRP